MSIPDRYTVKSIKANQTHDWCINKHYAKRIPPISWAFGLFNESLEGVCTFGKPLSHPLKMGVCGEEGYDYVYELNRLVINDHCPKNTASYFVSKCLKMLPDNLIILSYADTKMGHIGKVYQATNWIYTGLSAEFKDIAVKGMENKHNMTISDEFRGSENRVEAIKKKYGDKVYYKERSRKHRYVYFTGKEYKLNYPIKEYPKGKSKRYDASYIPQTQMQLL